MTRQSENNRVDKTLRKLSLDREAPKSAFILLVLLYAIATFLTVTTGRMHGETIIFGIPVEYTSLPGIFSTLGNICIILLVVLFRKVGYIVSVGLIILQLPMNYVNVFVRHNYRGLPGFFSSIMVIISITVIYLSYKKIINYQNSIREQAVTDRLTGLPNRFATGELMTDLLKKDERFCLVSTDLNNFKSVNDTMGHATGDLVLKEVANRWKTLANSMNTGTVDFVARNTGDEFLIVISDYQSIEDVENTIAMYKAELEKKITIDNCDYFMTACFGYTLCPDDTEVIENLYLFADSALHELKKSGSGSRLLRFTPEVLNTEKTLEIERKIRTALSEDKIFFNLQPQYDMNHKLRGFEALARMKDDDGSYICPADFIPVAEDTGLVDRIDNKVFELAVQFIKDVNMDTDHDITMSVNVSVRHLMKNNFIEEIKRVLDTYKVPAECIEIEITESIMIDSADKALQRIDELKLMGMKVAIDDFGTGYSSLSYLNSFPSDLLKIDKSFIDKMNMSASSRQYVAMIISIGHTLNLKVISEGVETSDQIDVLKQIGCDYIQGYVWGKPMPPEEAKKLLDQEHA